MKAKWKSAQVDQRGRSTDETLGKVHSRDSEHDDERGQSTYEIHKRKR